MQGNKVQAMWPNRGEDGKEVVAWSGFDYRENNDSPASAAADARFIAAARNLVPALRAALTAAEAERDALEISLDAANTAIGNMSIELSDMRVANGRLTARVATLTEMRDQSQRDYGDAVSRMEDMLSRAEKDEVRAEALREAVAYVSRRRETYHQEHGSYDYTTGVTEYPGTGDEYVAELEEIEEGITDLINQRSKAQEGGDA
ncbi:MAG: hypothetical protein PHX82_04910 [Paracoccaceae bacterium]|nr:hypothetical protein [Paracoccaceae bacterium]